MNDIKKTASLRSFVSKINITNNGGFVTNPHTFEEYYVSHVFLKGALDRDTVKVGISETKQFQSMAKIERVVSRYTQTFTAKLFAKKNQLAASIYPYQSKPITIKENLVNASIGDLVKIKIIDWRENHKTAYAKTLSIISSDIDNSSDFLFISGRYGLDDLPIITIKKREQVKYESILTNQSTNRVDLTGMPTISIDPDTARDFDDALSIEKKKYGYDLFIHIADVSSYVKEGDLVDKNAKIRANSYYFPEKVFHMLPEILSTDICSLIPGKNRLAFTLKVEMDTSYSIIKYSFFESTINSNERLTYTEVSKVLQGSSSSHHSDSLNMLNELTISLKKKRLNTGLSFTHHETVFIGDQISNINSNLTKEEDSHRIVEECMLIANKIAASEVIRFSKKNNLIGVFRNHDIPNQKNEIYIKNIIAKFSKQRSDSKKLTAKLINEFLVKYEGTDLQNIISIILIRRMNKAFYSTKNIGHYGLGFDEYTHFTSPIRRYADLVVHRILKKQLNNLNTLPESVIFCNNGERKAKLASRDYIKLKSLKWLERQGDKTFQGIIINIKPTFVTICETVTEIIGYIDVKTLPRDSYAVSSNRLALMGKFSKNRYEIGSKVDIKIEKIDILNQNVSFKIQ